MDAVSPRSLMIARALLTPSAKAPVSGWDQDTLISQARAAAHHCPGHRFTADGQAEAHRRVLAAGAMDAVVRSATIDIPEVALNKARVLWPSFLILVGHAVGADASFTSP